jgi:hypothetical protein
MLAGRGRPIERDKMRSSYLYANGLAALRDQLLAAGVAVGEIRDGSPGPAREMGLADPDGWCLMVAEIE